MKNKIAVCMLVIIAAAAALPSCSNDRVEEGADGMEWPDRTEKEDCIRVLEMSYMSRDSAKLEELLLKPDSAGVFPGGFRYYVFGDDTESPILEMKYADEIKASSGLFRHADSLNIKFSGGGWERLDELRGRVCEDCWKAEREESFIAVVDDRTYAKKFQIGIIVGPDPAGGGRYVIYQFEGSLPGEGREYGKLQ